jgi:hypothetical protein
LPGLRKKNINQEKEGNVISQYMLYFATGGSKPIRPNITSFSVGIRQLL